MNFIRSLPNEYRPYIWFGTLILAVFLAGWAITCYSAKEIVLATGLTVGACMSGIAAVLAWPKAKKFPGSD